MRWFPLLVVVVVAACAPSSDAKPEAVAQPSAPAEKAAAAPAPSRDEEMARKVLVAIAANDVEQLRALSSPGTWAELGDLVPGALRKLRAALAAKDLDPAKLTLVRVEPSGSSIITVDMVLEHAGKRFRTHFNVMRLDGRNDFMGLAEWVKPEP